MQGTPVSGEQQPPGPQGRILMLPFVFDPETGSSELGELDGIRDLCPLQASLVQEKLSGRLA